MDRLSSYLHRAPLNLDRPSSVPSKRQRPPNLLNNPQALFNQDGIASYRAARGGLLPPNQPKSNSQHPPQQPQPAEPKQNQPPAPASGIQQRPSNESNNPSPPQPTQPQPQPEPKQDTPPVPASAPSPAKGYLIITYKDRDVLMTKSPTLAELKQAAAEIFDITLDHHKHLYAFVHYKPVAAEPALELEIHESAYGSLKDRDHVFFKHRESELERPDGEVGRRRRQGVLTGVNGSAGTSGGSSGSSSGGEQQGRGYGCGNSLNGTGQHAALHVRKTTSLWRWL